VIGSKQNLSPVDKDELSVNQFFIRYHFNNRWSALIGRENMRLGSGRLVDIREGPNVRLSFDMVKLDYADPNTELSAFYAVPVQPESGIFDNTALDFDTESLAGLYWTQTWHSAMRTDAYLLYKDEKNKTWNAGTADDQRVSLGFRHFGSWKELSYNNEFVFQTGSFGEQNISAWTASFNVELPSKLFGENGVVGIKTEAISGDTDASDNRLNTFDGLYPRGAYFGRVARIGPSNLFDVHPYIDTFVGPLSLEVDYVAFWRLSRQDGVYGPPLNLQYPAVNEQRFIGHQLGTIVGFEINAFVNLELETNVIFPGDFLKDSGLGDTLFHAVFTAELKF
ncbi:MAG: alginate export family protein, partial [Bacteroidota bacterium]